MNEKAVVSQFLSDIYTNCSGDITLVSSLSPFRCEVVPVTKLKKQSFDFSRESFFSTSSYKSGTVQKNGKGRSKNNLLSSAILHFDFDKKRFDLNEEAVREYFTKKSLPMPSYVFSREDRAHVYFLLDRPITTDFSVLEDTLKRLSRQLDCDVLPAHPAALMRVPFTAHIKKGKTSPGYRPIYTGRHRYGLNDFSGVVSVNDGAAPGPRTASPAMLEEMLLRDRKKIHQAGGRSAGLYQFALRCRDFGLEEKAALAFVRQFNDKYCEPPEDSKIVEHQTASAYKYAKHPPGRYLNEKPEKLARKLEEDTKISENLADFVYVAEAEVLINTKTGLRYSKASQIENAIAWATGVKTSLQYVLTFRLITLKDRISFRPGEPKEFISADVSYYNTFDELQPVTKTKIRKSDVKIFENHLRYLTNTEQEFLHLRRFLASALLCPGQKIKHSLLLISTYEGIGKSVLQTLAEKILISERETPYVVSTSNTEIARGNNSWIESKFLTFVHELGQSEKFAVLDQLKNWITEPRVRISDKYLRSYEIENHCNFIFFSNAVNALPISTTDRRFFIVINRKKPQDAEYYENLLNAFEDGLFSIIEYLRPFAKELKLNAPPPVTDSKLEVRNYSRNELTIFLDECLHDPAYNDFFRGKFTIRSLAERIQDSARASNIRFSQKQTAMWLRDNNFLEHRDARSRWYERDNVIRKENKFRKGKKQK